MARRGFDRRRVSAALLLCCLVVSPVRADADTSLKLVEAHLRRLGAAADSAAAARVFLQQGEARVVAQEIAGGECAGFIAFAGGSVRDVDLSLHTQGGLLLDADTSAAPYAYVRGCAEVPQTWFVNIGLYAGRGELTLLRIANAPASIDRLPFELGLAAPSGGRPERPRSVGPGLPRVTFEQRRVQRERDWLERGYMAAGAPLKVPIAAGMARASLQLEEGLCYAVTVATARSQRTGVVLAGPAGGQWSGAAPGTNAVVHVCPKESANHDVFIKVRPGGSLAWVRAYVQPDASRWRAPGAQADLDDGARVRVGELRHHFETRGMETSILGEGWLDTVGPLQWSLRLRAGACYGFAAVTRVNDARGPLHLGLEAEDGRLLARSRRAGSPAVYHCPTSALRARLVVRAVGEVGRIVIVRGERVLDGSEKAP